MFSVPDFEPVQPPVDDHEQTWPEMAVDILIGVAVMVLILTVIVVAVWPWIG